MNDIVGWIALAVVMAVIGSIGFIITDGWMRRK